jgi:class 3 adenylate cyclase/tetratricopeptide (TPR) repeat protein
VARSGYKLCPFCAEEIREAAVMCRFCKTPLSPEASEALRKVKGGSVGAVEESRSSDESLRRLSKFLPRTVLEGLFEGIESIEEGERRTVTVVFADLCRFTRLAEVIDPEDLASLVNEAYKEMETAIRRYDGLVDKFVGDAVLAVFGAPIAHEDDPERAVRAALDLREAIAGLGLRLGLPLFVRVGINAGEVVLRAFGSERRADYTAIGDAVNLASRLEGSAAEGEILISHRVARSVRGVFRTEALPPLELKGKAKSVRAHRVLGEIKRFSKVSLGERVELTEFIGRELELETLAGLLRRTVEGRGQVAVIKGEGGVGKSRLVYEFYHSHAKERVDWFTGRCLSYGASVPFQPFAELLRRIADIEESDGPRERRKKISALVGRRTKREGGRAERGRAPGGIREALEIVLGTDEPSNPLHGLEPQDRRKALFAAVRWVLTAQAKRRPTVYVFEDIHWADDLSLSLLDTLVKTADQATVLLLIVTRPSLAHRFPDQAGFTQISLPELGQDQSALLIRHLLHLHRIPPEVEDFILKRTGGNPFFVEEVALTLREQGVLVPAGKGLRLARPLEEAHVPDSLESLIISRLDHLDNRVRQVIQCASVIGQEFRLRVLENVTEARERLQTALAQLLESDFIIEKSLLPEIEYLFRNTLTQEVTYHTLLRRRRAIYHLRVAQALERLYPDRLDEHVELIAHHAFWGEDNERARHYLRLAAEKCKFLDANLAAIDFSERLLLVLRERLGGAPDFSKEIGDVLLDLGRLHYLTGDLAASEKHYREAMEHAGRFELRDHLVVALRNIGDVLRLRGRPREGEKAVRQALRRCGPEDRPARAACHLNLGVILMETGRLPEARRQMESFFEWARTGAENIRQRYIASANLGLICRHMGDLGAAQTALDRACGLAEEMGRRREQAEALLNRAGLDMDRGDLREAKRRLDRSLRLAKEIDHGRLILTARLALAELAHCRGRLPEAAALTRDLLEEAERQGHEHLIIAGRVNLAQIRLAQGHVEEAGQSIAEARRLSDDEGDHSVESQILATQAEINLARGEPETASRHIRKALAVARARGMERELIFALRAAGRIALATGDPLRANTHLNEAGEIATRLAAKRELAWILLEQAELRARQGQIPSPDLIEQLSALAEDVEDGVLVQSLRRVTALRTG